MNATCMKHDQTVKVSIITVVYNSKNTICDCMLSVQRQNYKNFEHIIIDGASTDGSVDVIKENITKDTFFLSEPDSGIYDAMNKGLRHASGDVVCFLNSDDYFSDQCVLTSVISFMDNYNYDVVMTDVEIVSRTNPNKRLRKYTSRNISLAKMRWGIMPPHPGVFLKKQILSKSGFFDNSYKIAGDFDFLFRVFSLPNIKISSFSFSSVIMRSGGISGSGLGNKFLLNSEVRRCLVNNGVGFVTLRLICKYFYKVKEFSLVSVFSLFR